MNTQNDPYASEADTDALMAADTRTPAERWLALLLDEHGGNEQGAEPEQVLRRVALALIEGQAGPTHREVMQQALDALELARSSHGVMLMTDPPQELWKTRGVDAALLKSAASIREALAAPTTPEFAGIARQKLERLQAKGWCINGVHIQRAEADSSFRHGAVTAQGMVLWWHGKLGSEALAAPQPAQKAWPLDHIACIDGGELRYVSGRCAPNFDCELYAMPGGGPAPKLYAAPQAPRPAQEQEPVAFSVQCSDCGGDGLDAKDANYRCMQCCGFGFVERLLYTAPQPQRERQPLTDEQIDTLRLATGYAAGILRFTALARAIEAAHGITKGPAA